MGWWAFPNGLRRWTRFTALHLFFSSDGRHVGRLRVLRRSLGRTAGRRLLPAPDEPVPGPLVQPGSSSHSLFHIFGRIGCFLGGCCYGLPSAWGVVYRYSPVAEANGLVRFPVQLVEAAWNLVLFLLLAWLQRRGSPICCPCIWSSIPPARFLLEFFRGDAYRGILLGLSTSQWISLFLFPAALYALLRGRN